MISHRVAVLILSTLAVATLAAAAQLPSAVLAAGQSDAAEPSLPVIDENACPFEGCTFGKWKVIKESAVYSSWRSDRRQIDRIKPGQEVLGLTGVHVTLKPDRILVRREIPRLGLKPGDVLLRYMTIGEGFANIWAKGAWHKEEDCSFITEKDGSGCSRDCAAVVGEYGVNEWWVKIKISDEKVGWVRVDENFNGMDALGAVPLPVSPATDESEKPAY
ncbi:MAG TPA: hypothetical protein VFA67_18765 [Candidatus Sulfotelmatobacter sp.]|nr:hypothetical protein [Candidatus Sulfotelmatobacter sp.]